MEKLIVGHEVTSVAEYGSYLGFCNFFTVVKKGHENCGDSAFIYYDENRLIAGVFDGVSGEADAEKASASAAKFFLSSLKKDKPTKKTIEDATHFVKTNIKSGYTTAALFIVEKNGEFLAAGIGDSPIYSIDKNRQVDIELPLSRIVGNKDSILKFFNFRNIVSSVLGGFGSEKNPEIHLNIRQGKLAKGEKIILATDCLVDNLFVETDEGFVTEAFGKKDLGYLINGLDTSEKIAKKLFIEIQSRIKGGKIEEKTRILIPKEDDLAMVIISFE